ncbi:hypothetical protein [Staphylococcus haemolyticus]|uniref:hypothetical protein n=1 Tax=Staphylococcus haemolyticus TaxID=1283 RepID=UPI002593E30C|nr:hypothetical protein [Staphylococcus haemolyticus]MDM3980657.1 hypothetical protein [Staphylococcus haemolyticus]
MRKKIKDLDYLNIVIIGILSAIGFSMIVLLIAIPIYTVAEYKNKEIYTGEITDKYNKRSYDTDDFYIVLDNKKVIANTDLIFKGKFNSADIQAQLKVGEKIKVKTIGYRVPFLNFYPKLYEIEKVKE